MTLIMSELILVILSISISGFFIFLLLVLLEKLLCLTRKKQVYFLMKLILLFYFITPILILFSCLISSYKKHLLIQGEDFIFGRKMSNVFLYQSYIKNESFTVLFFISIIWLVGFFVLYFYRIIRYQYNLKRLIKVSYLNFNNTITNIMDELSKTLGITKQICVYTSNVIHSPFITQVFHPIIFLPEINFTNENLEFILKHELIHCKNHDILFRNLLVYVKCFYWINPLLYFFIKSYNDNCEITCDQICLDKTAKQTQLAYINTILMFISNTKEQNGFVGFYSSSIIERRILSIMKLNKHQKNISAFILSAVIILMFPLVSYAATQNTSLMQSMLGKTLESKNNQQREVNPPNNASIYEEQSEILIASRQTYGHLEIAPYGVNFIDCNLNNERLTIESLELSKGTKVQFFLTGYNETDKFRAGIINNNTITYVKSVNGAINYTFTIDKDGTYDLFIDSDDNVDVSGTINLK